MNRSARRRFEKEFDVLLRTDGDHCTICRKPLEHNERTYGGLTTNEKVALTANCCQKKLSVQLVTGLYMTRYSETLPPIEPRDDGDITPSADVERSIDALQQHFGRMEAIVADVRKRAGVKGQAGMINFDNSPWKTDDADWFKERPGRSHRLRQMFDGEILSLPSELASYAIPDGHRMEVIIRQIEPGKRVRLPFGRNINVPIPDHESILHALFDRVAKGGGQVIGVAEVAEIAKLHESSKGGSKN